MPSCLILENPSTPSNMSLVRLYSCMDYSAILDSLKRLLDPTLGISFSHQRIVAPVSVTVIQFLNATSIPSASFSLPGPIFNYQPHLSLNPCSHIPVLILICVHYATLSLELHTIRSPRLFKYDFVIKMFCDLLYRV